MRNDPFWAIVAILLAFFAFVIFKATPAGREHTATVPTTLHPTDCRNGVVKPYGC